MNTIPETLNPERLPRESKGLKEHAVLNRVSFTPVSAVPNQILYVDIPKLADNDVIVPGSVYLIFDLNVSDHKDNTLVNNVGRNLISNLRVTFAGETIQDINRFDLFQTYHDLYLPKEEREDRMIQGISSENMRKLRTNAGDKDTSDAKAVRMAAIHNTKYAIPLDHPILRDHGVLYPRALNKTLRFEIKLAPVADVVVYSNAEDPPNYTLNNIHLEYKSIMSDYLASSIVVGGTSTSFQMCTNHPTTILLSTIGIHNWNPQLESTIEIHNWNQIRKSNTEIKYRNPGADPGFYMSDLQHLN